MTRAKKVGRKVAKKPSIGELRETIDQVALAVARPNPDEYHRRIHADDRGDHRQKVELDDARPLPGQPQQKEQQRG